MSFARTSYLPFAAPDIGDEEIEEVIDTLRNGWITTGPKVRRFETEFAQYIGCKHVIAVNSCTAALHLALEAAGVGRGDEVIVPAYTFAATAEVVRYFDARPVLVDVDPRTLSMCPDRLAAAITRRTRAIVPVHFAGLPADMDPIETIARRRKLIIVEDAAHSFPARYKGRMIGAQGDFVCFSFYATKTITTGEGGVVCTNDDSWADRCRVMALHGISKDAWKRYTAEGSWYYEVIAPGFKYNLTDIAAALGLAQLAKAKRMWERRREIAQIYHSAFADHPALEIPPDDPRCQHAWHIYCLRLHLERLKVDRAAFVEALRRRNIGVSVHFIPLHVHPYYRDTFGYRATDFPVSHEQYLRAISLPIYSKMSDRDVGDVVAAVLETATECRL